MDANGGLFESTNTTARGTCCHCWERLRCSDTRCKLMHRSASNATRIPKTLSVCMLAPYCCVKTMCGFHNFHLKCAMTAMRSNLKAKQTYPHPGPCSAITALQSHGTLDPGTKHPGYPSCSGSNFSKSSLTRVLELHVQGHRLKRLGVRPQAQPQPQPNGGGLEPFLCT